MITRLEFLAEYNSKVLFQLIRRSSQKSIGKEKQVQSDAGQF